MAQETGVVKDPIDIKPSDVESIVQAQARANANEDLGDLLHRFLQPQEEEWEDIFGEEWDKQYPDQPKRDH